MPDKPKGFDPNQMLGLPEAGGRAEIWIGNAAPADTTRQPSTQVPRPAPAQRSMLGKAPYEPVSRSPNARPAARSSSNRPPVDQAKLPPYLRGHPAFRS